jgi:hypothetical protein
MFTGGVHFVFGRPLDPESDQEVSEMPVLSELLAVTPLRDKNHQPGGGKHGDDHESGFQHSASLSTP